jgi:predicted LPLAT superfamily acyltransferase
VHPPLHGVAPSETGVVAVVTNHDERAETWLSQGERGTLLGIRLFYWTATVFGRTPARVMVRLIALWYAVFGQTVARASRQWLRTVLEREVGFSDVYRHFMYFAQTIADRMFLVQGKVEPFATTRTGHHHLERALDNGTGAILLGAHVGSFEALRAGSKNTNLPLTIVGHFENAKMINQLLTQLSPEAAARVIHITPESVDFIFSIKQCIEKGELLGTMGDRVGLNEKSVEVEFFGRKAFFPTGPFVLASVLKCPVFLTLGLYSEPNHYALHCEPLVEQVVLSRKQRQQDLTQHVQHYASRLEHYCRQAPYNWFNFYDFWVRR